MKKLLAVLFLLMVCVNSDAGLKAVSSGNTYLASNVAVTGGSVTGLTTFSTGTGTTTTAGLQVVNGLVSGWVGLGAQNLTLSSANYAMLIKNDASGVNVNAATGGTVSLTVNNVAAITAAAGSGPTLTGVTTGTNADFLCLSAAGVVLLQTSACTISSMRFKRDVELLEENALSEVRLLHPVAFNMREGERPNADPNYDRRQIGLLAENVAQVDPRMAIYENDGVTPKSYRQEAVIALLVKAVQEQQAKIEQLDKELARITARRYVEYRP